MSHTNNPDLFPNLRAVKLESFAHTWAEYFTFIKHISLYQKPVNGFDFRVKYIMFFELSEIRETDGFSERDESFIELLEGPDALTWLNTKSGDFKEIYRDTPNDRFFDEWCFVTNLPEGIGEKHSWTLFSRTEEKTDNHKGGLIITPAEEKTGNYDDFISVCLQKVLDKSGIKIRESFRFQIPFSGRLSNL